jgi:hypothetical protein
MMVQVDEAGFFRDLAQALRDCQLAQPPHYNSENPFEATYGPDVTNGGDYVIYAERYAPHRSAQTVINIHIRVPVTSLQPSESSPKTDTIQRLEQFLVENGGVLHNSSCPFTGFWHICALWGPSI